jgi:DNA-binding transcriptional regulator YiaG
VTSARTKRADRDADLAHERAKVTADRDQDDDAANIAPASPGWAELVERAGGSPFQGKAFLALVASGRAGYPALGGAWPKDGQAREWREAAGVTTLQVANVLQVPTELVDAWDDGQEPFYGNWNGTPETDDLSARRLYGSFRSYKQNGPYAPAPAPTPTAERPPVEVIGAAGFPRRELLEAAALGYEVPVTGLAGESKFLGVVVRGEVVGIPTLVDIPDGSELRRIREESNYTPERWGVLLGAPASRVLNWEAGNSVPGHDVDGGLPAALRLYGTCQAVLDLKAAA